MAPKHILSAATVILNETGKFVLIQGPKRGWEIPGGQVEEGESLTAAAVREAEEECGLKIEVIQFCGIYQNVERSICNALFIGKVTGGELKRTEEALDVGFFTLEEAERLVTWTNFLERIKACLDEKNRPFLHEW
ncbi:NUDIX domain-containing protein [Halobacillus litoralis]|uniref:NUDIX domain-containing protein n=1 Tax=Halobacillus litoralis TaxID=45668 RepID=A0A845DQ61_9BACI|nr:NUDIX domain-containing protein [Halobacillus litoralis]MYL19603.1 NUDIX domain-containing protein [Halobacillus litoralis]MYL36997.1 NUDIX domain-containing protein [Halobacillus litoralis]